MRATFWCHLMQDGSESPEFAKPLTLGQVAHKSGASWLWGFVRILVRYRVEGWIAKLRNDCALGAALTRSEAER